MSHDNGGTAFPKQPIIHHPGAGDMVYPQEGMTLHDYFMIHAPEEEIDALMGETAAQAAEYLGIPTEDYEYPRDYMKCLVKARSQWATAMIAEKRRIEKGE